MIDLNRIPSEVWEMIHPCPNTGCWLWGGNGDIYGSINKRHTPSGQTVAHRAVYSLTREVPKKGMDLDHLCRNTMCVNPEHLEEVTRAENARRSVGKSPWRLARIRATPKPTSEVTNPWLITEDHALAMMGCGELSGTELMQARAGLRAAIERVGCRAYQIPGTTGLRYKVAEVERAIELLAA